MIFSDRPTWRIIPGLGSVINNHRLYSKSTKWAWVCSPSIHGLSFHNLYMRVRSDHLSSPIYLRPGHAIRAILPRDALGHPPCHLPSNRGTETSEIDWKLQPRNYLEGHPRYRKYHGPPKPTFLEVFMVNNLVFRWPKPLFFVVLGAHGS